MPDKSYYDPDGMSPARKEEFLRWYNELLTYCQSDVRLLKQGCMTFQSQFKDIVNFNPMKECITIASACNVAYRKQWMLAHKIAVEPVRGWWPKHNQSHWNGSIGKKTNLWNPISYPELLTWGIEVKGYWCMEQKVFSLMGTMNKLVLCTNSKDASITDVSGVFQTDLWNIPFTWTKPCTMYVKKRGIKSNNWPPWVIMFEKCGSANGI